VTSSTARGSLALSCKRNSPAPTKAGENAAATSAGGTTSLPLGTHTCWCVLQTSAARHSLLFTHKVWAGPSSSKTQPPPSDTARAELRGITRMATERSAGLRRGGGADNVETCPS
jgi:hypothetical protein